MDFRRPSLFPDDKALPALHSIPVLLRRSSGALVDRLARLPSVLYATATEGSADRGGLDVFASAEALTTHDGRRTLRFYRWGPSLDSGRSSRRRVVILVHGWGGSAHSMLAFVEPFRRRGFDVVAFDQPAHGGSSGIRATLVSSAAGLSRVASHVDPLYAIVGHSFGGVVGAMTLCYRGEDPQLRHVERLVLISSPDRMSDIVSRYGDELHIGPAPLSFMRARIEEVAGRPIETLSTRAFVAASKIPTLIVHDAKDKEVPVTDGEAVAADSPHARLLRTDRLGHRRVLRAKSVVGAVTDFLEDGGRAGVAYARKE